MPPFAETPPLAFQISLMLAILACAMVWAATAVRWLHGQPVIPYQPRRSVPWKLADVALLMLLFFIGPGLLLEASRHWLHFPFPASPSQVAEKSRIEMEHPLERVLLERPSISAVVTGVLLAVVIAPVTEELLFRLVLQGWLESLERRLRRRNGWLRRISAGVLPVGLTSLAFAALHIRGAAERVDVSATVIVLSVQVAASLLTVVVTLGWLRFAVGATSADLGLAPRKLASDVRLGVLAFFAVAVPVYAVNVLLLAVREWLSSGVIVDPLPLLLLAAALGTLYYRTHRIMPCIALHMAFNTVAVVVAFLTPPG